LFSDDPNSPIGRERAPFPALRGSLDHLILCGDFNAGALSPLYLLLRRRLADAQRAAGRSAHATFPSRFPVLRLDHVWIGKALTAEAVAVPRDALARRASDHLPIVVDLLLRSTQPAPAAASAEGLNR
jgi:endonuclease/exonuclease/phosphatase family metal-dependent hydrolase